MHSLECFAGYSMFCLRIRAKSVSSVISLKVFWRKHKIFYVHFISVYFGFVKILTTCFFTQKTDTTHKIVMILKVFNCTLFGTVY